MDDCKGHHINHGRASGNERRFKEVAEILCHVEHDLRHVLSYQIVLDDGLFDVCSVNPSRCALLLSCINAARNSRSLAVPAFHEFEPARYSCLEKDSKGSKQLCNS